MSSQNSQTKKRITAHDSFIAIFKQIILMKITVDIKFEQLLDMIKKLPAAKIKQLKSSLDDSFIQKKAGDELSDFQDFLLNGPIMSSEQYNQYLQNRVHFNSWRTK